VYKSHRPNEDTAPDAAPKAKRSLGQNFLRDANIAGKIVRCLAIQPGETVLEIGPGQGALTGFLEQSPAERLILVEKDRHWAAERMRQGQGRVRVILADALTMPWERFVAPWKCIGNLPYNVASPLMWDICAGSPGLSRAVFMVQKEVGLRVTAKPGTSAYGALSVWLQSFMRPKLEFVVPPQVFQPRPKVDSAVLSFTPLAPQGEAGARPFVPALLSAALRACFQKRRQQLGGIINSLGQDPAVLERLGIDPAQRPETLSPEQFQALSGTGVFGAA
jgi:16S rRNA (adenine1518-N6/adenine1519-N6)-dimethyltransferase